MPSFDIVSEVDVHEVQNAVDNANREVITRFDFKGSNAKFELTEEMIQMSAQSDFQLQQMLEILKNKIVKRNVDVASLEINDPEIAHNQAKQTIKIKQGLDKEFAKKVVKLIKDSKLKVQAAIQGEQVRVTGKKRDDLQQAIAHIKEQKLDMPLQYVNFRD